MYVRYIIGKLFLKDDFVVVMFHWLAIQYRYSI